MGLGLQKPENSAAKVTRLENPLKSPNTAQTALTHSHEGINRKLFKWHLKIAGWKEDLIGKRSPYIKGV